MKEAKYQNNYVKKLLMIFEYLNRWNEDVSDCCGEELIINYTKYGIPHTKQCSRCGKFAKKKENDNGHNV